MLVKILVVLFIVGTFYNLWAKYVQAKREALATAGNARPVSYPPDLIDLYERAYNLETGFDADNQDLKRAVEFYKLAAAQDYPPAAFRLAHLYAYGKKELALDYEQALSYCEQAGDYPGTAELKTYINERLEIQRAHARLDAERRERRN